MPSHQVRALSLKKTKLGETDLIVTFLAADGCQVRAVAKGARKPGSRFGGRVEPFTVVDMLLHSGRTLETITEAEIARIHAPVGLDIGAKTPAEIALSVMAQITATSAMLPLVIRMLTFVIRRSRAMRSTVLCRASLSQKA